MTFWRTSPICSNVRGRDQHMARPGLNLTSTPPEKLPPETCTSEMNKYRGHVTLKRDGTKKIIKNESEMSSATS